MNFEFREDGVLRFHQVESTQDTLSSCVRAGNNVVACIANSQTRGRGRFTRKWHSPPGSSFSGSFAFWEYPNHPRPYLIGMASAISMARAINGQLQWPNDIVLDGKKVAGILSEVIHTPDGDGITLVGIGVNVSQTHFPAEIAHRATSLLLAGHPSPSLDRLEADFISELIKIPTPESWDSLRAHWMERDQTPGKVYMLPDGNIGTAVEVTSNGSLNVAVLDKTIEVSVAEAIFG